jgi:acyl carrier protein
MSSNKIETVKAKLVDVVATALELRADEVTDDLSSDTCMSWDSLRHLRLVLSVEDAFAVSFGEDEIISLTSVSAFLGALLERLPD